MNYLDLNILTAQIEDVFKKYEKKLPEIKIHKFSQHMSLVIGGYWEFYFDKKDDGYIFSSVTDSNYNDDITLSKIKAYIVCDLINNKIIS